LTLFTRREAYHRYTTFSTCPDAILTDKLTTIIGDQINLVDSVRGDKTIRVSDFIYIVESVLRETWGEGWSGKIMEITNPKKVLFIEVEKIKKVLGIES